MINIHDEVVMRELSRIALQEATQTIAKRAREFSKGFANGGEGQMALRAFANAIESTNNAVFDGGKDDIDG